jgi:hypothetical protein
LYSWSANKRGKYVRELLKNRKKCKRGLQCKEKITMKEEPLVLTKGNHFGSCGRDVV